MKKKELEFLKESNAIEGVFDDESLEQAKIAWEYLMEQKVLSIQVILKTHKILMLKQLMPDERGYFRTVDVFVGMNKTLPPHLIRLFLVSWVEKTNRLTSRTPYWKSLHVEYEGIHPFVDGNGRTGRMFMNWTRVKKCGLPILIIKNAEKQAYYAWFK